MNERAGELIVYIASQSAGDRAFGATKLNKILFFIDFYAYGLWGNSITEATYIRMEHGPVPRELPDVQAELETSGRVAVQTREYYGKEQKRLVALVEPDMVMFSEKERRLIDDILDSMKRFNATRLSDWTHRLRPWLAAKNGEKIPYSAVFVLNNTPISREDMEWGERTLQELRDVGLVLRDIVEEARFSQDTDAFRRKYPRFEEVLEWITWELARNPIIGTPLANFPDFRVLRTDRLLETPGFRVLYTFDTEKVYLHVIAAIDTSGEED